MSEPTPDEPEEEAGSGSERVRLFVSDRLILVGRDATMRQMAQRMVAEGVGALVVTEGAPFLPHFLRNLRSSINSGRDLASTPPPPPPSPPLPSCPPHPTLPPRGRLRLGNNYVRHLLVTDETGPVGMVSARDLLGAYRT